jgi:hypothetical protein
LLTATCRSTTMREPIVACPWQQRVRESIVMLRCVYIAYLYLHTFVRSSSMFFQKCQL